MQVKVVRSTFSSSSIIHPRSSICLLLSQATGVSPLMAQMVIRSDFLLTLYEDIDHSWKILTETSIKAKNTKGFKCRNYKMTSNKFYPDQGKPESLEDWDPRYVFKS